MKALPLFASLVLAAAVARAGPPVSVSGIHPGLVVFNTNGESPAGRKLKDGDFLCAIPPKSNEDAGALAEWNGKEWRIVERRPFTEVTGPGGLEGSPDDTAPLWATGVDRRPAATRGRGAAVRGAPCRRRRSRRRTAVL